MALADAPGPCADAAPLPRRVPLPSLGSVPPTALILVGIVSVQMGAGIAKHMFAAMSPSAVVLLRLATSAAVLAVLCRGALRAELRGRTRRDLAMVAGFGLTLALMNFSIYQSFQRIPLGMAVTVEFLGPLVVAIAGSRRARDAVWALLAFAGVALLAQGGSTDLIGIGFALLAGAAWAGYILLSAATGQRFSGTTGLAIASVVGAAAVAPAGIATGGPALLDPRLLLLGLGVGLLSSVVPYTLELEALRRMPPRLFSILMSLEPAAAALIGLALLGEVLSARQWAAIGCVIVACVGATYGRREPPRAAEG
ncbi:EamA family transporter [Actinomadura parmotrematis]|uniref:EamA family transporter n=1 Tax=Actinomadura parmotrematis TaxID=2864039 RepID=A0ABS7FUU9_9ACTN|nr:EamA family transporter [Actinomadura parmotrematis]MBW8483278.1 EamA family transporter [Actinomadura parmotrematis]